MNRLFFLTLLLTASLSVRAQQFPLSVKEGKMGATVAQKPAEIGAVGVEVADKIIKKEEVPANVPVALELIVK